MRKVRPKVWLQVQVTMCEPVVGRPEQSSLSLIIIVIIIAVAKIFPLKDKTHFNKILSKAIRIKPAEWATMK